MENRWWEGKLDRRTARNWAIDLANSEEGPGAALVDWDKLKEAYSLSNEEFDLLWSEYDKLPHWNPWDLLWE